MVFLKRYANFSVEEIEMFSVDHLLLLKEIVINFIKRDALSGFQQQQYSQLITSKKGKHTAQKIIDPYLKQFDFDQMRPKKQGSMSLKEIMKQKQNKK